MMMVNDDDNHKNNHRQRNAFPTRTSLLIIDRECTRTTTSVSIIQFAITGIYRSTNDVCLSMRHSWRKKERWRRWEERKGSYLVQISPMMMMILLRMTASLLTSSSRINIYCMIIDRHPHHWLSSLIIIIDYYHWSLSLIFIIDYHYHWLSSLTILQVNASWRG